MKRDKLRNIISSACEDAETSPEETRRLVATAETIDKVAVGSFRRTLEDGTQCGCPATLAGFFDPTCAETDEDAGWQGDATPEVRSFPGSFDSRVDRALAESAPDWLTPDREAVRIED